MIAREKPASLVWEQTLGESRFVASLDAWKAVVWYVGGDNPWRSRLRRTMTPTKETRVVSHWKEETAKASAEKRLRKAGA